MTIDQIKRVNQRQKMIIDQINTLRVNKRQKMPIDQINTKG